MFFLNINKFIAKNKLMSNRRKNKERIPLTKDFFNYSNSTIYNTINYNIGGILNVSSGPPSTIFSSQRNELLELQEKYFLNEGQQSYSASQNPKEDHSESNIKDNDEIDLNSASKDRFIFIKTKDNSNIEVNMKTVSNFTILELKKFVFPKLFEEKNIRFIWNGKMLTDNEKLDSINLESGAFIHAFISDKIEKRERTITNMSNNELQNAANSIRGFERLKDLGIPPEDVILQKFAFHSHFVMIQKNTQTDFTSLVNREEEWYAMNIEKLANMETNSVWFKNYDFYGEADPENGKNNIRFFWLLLGFIVGFFLTLAILPLLFVTRINFKIKEALIIGLISKMFYICSLYLILKEIRFFY